MDEQTTSFKWKPELIWAIVAFLIGTIFSAGLNLGKSNTNLDSVNLKLVEIQASLEKLNTKYTDSHETTAVELNRIEQHLTYVDGRLDKLEIK